MDEAALQRRHKDAAFHPPETFEMGKLCTNSLQSDDSVAQASCILEATRVGELAQPSAETRQGIGRPCELVRFQRPCGELGLPARAQRT
jgi:hypothetical protein